MVGLARGLAVILAGLLGEINFGVNAFAQDVELAP